MRGLGFLRGGLRRDGDVAPRESLARLEQRLEQRFEELIDEHERLAKREARVLAHESAPRAEAPEPAVPEIPDVDDRQRELAERVQAVTARELGLAKQAAGLAARERALAEVGAGHEQRARELESRDRELDRRELELSERAAALAERELELAKRPPPAPARRPRPFGEARPHRRWNLVELERLVEKHGAENPERLEEWSSYLYFLRDHAGRDGALPDAFDWLLADVFAELVD